MISVVIPTYNRKGELERSVGSVFGQTRQDFEIIIVDDCSTDGTEEFVKEHFKDPRVRFERLEKNSGVHAARNRGLEVARGEFVVFLDSDDEWVPHALERAMKPMQDKSFGLVSAPYTFLTGELTGFERADGEIPFEDLLCECGVRKRKGGFGLMRRSIMGDIRWVERNLDFIFFRRVAAKTRLYYIAEPLGFYHVSTGVQMSKVRRRPDPGLSVLRARALATFLDEFGEQLIAKCPNMYGFYAYGAAVGLLLDAEIARARHFAFGALRYQPRLKYALFYLFSLIPASPGLLKLLFDFKIWLLKTR